MVCHHFVDLFTMIHLLPSADWMNFFQGSPIPESKGLQIHVSPSANITCLHLHGTWCLPPDMGDTGVHHPPYTTISYGG